MQGRTVSHATVHPTSSPAGRAGARTPQRPTLAARIVRGLFLTASKPGVPNLSLLAKAVCSQLMRRPPDRPAPVVMGAPGVPAVIVLTGPSGGGKSLLLGEIERELLNPRRERHAGHSAKTTPGTGTSRSVAAASVATHQSDLLIVRADMLRHAVTVQGVRATVSQRAKLRDAGAEGGTPNPSAPGAASAPVLLTCDPPLDFVSVVTSDSRTPSRTVGTASQYHTRIQPADVRAVHHWLSCLASAGLADAGVLLLPVHRLSTGQRARHTLAVAMHRCTPLHPSASHAGTHPPRRVLLVDELGSALDAISAVSVTISLRRWAVANNIALVVATADPRMVTALQPQLAVELPLHNGLAEPRASSLEKAKR